MLAELLVAPLRRAVQEAASGQQLQRREDPRLEGLPPAMLPNNPVGATSVCAMMASHLGGVNRLLCIISKHVCCMHGFCPVSCI